MTSPLKTIALISAVEIMRSRRDIWRTACGRNKTRLVAAARTIPRMSAGTLVTHSFVWI